MKQARAESGSAREGGFTLIEVMIAVLVLMIGLAAVSNLIVVAASSNAIGNHITLTTSQATEVMERLKAIPFDQLVAGGDLANDVVGTCEEPLAADCVVAGNYNIYRTVTGTGRVRTRWMITTPVMSNMMFVQVRSEVVGRLGPLSRTDLAMYRVWSSGGAPAEGN